ncbi:MAG: [FeFe] hydrogenase, group A [Oscillospiraceae bacterium]|nr:[FeFe] hydrogenase, group A [Oscillospiraceae bacterium]
MVKLTINGKKVEAKEGTTILQAANASGIAIPFLCYMPEINEIGACRVCVVEVEGIDSLVAACNTKIEEGMSVLTNSPRVRKARRTNVQFILSQHDCNCPTCSRNGNCSLQDLARELNIQDVYYSYDVPENKWDTSFPLVRIESKCIKCMRCIQICDKVQSLNVWDVSGTGGRTSVDVSENRTIKEAPCALCGQCITNCPVGALMARDDSERVFEALEDPDIITIVQVAPAVRSAWAESFGISREFATPKRMAAALRSLGFDYVFDTNFAADLTIMEEGAEFIERFTNSLSVNENADLSAEHKHPGKMPMFTSCCPGWVRFLKSQYPELKGNLSTAKSPQQMFGALTKSYFAEKIGVDPKNIFSVSVMPCTAKKSECDLPEMIDGCGDPDVDVVITTRELSNMLHSQSVVVPLLPEEEFDSPLGSGTGAAVVFGASGGVMDAALRSAYFLVTGENPDPDAFTAVRGVKGWKEATFNVPGAGDVRVAVVSGLGNARSLIEALKKGEVSYDFVEVMACPGGCAGGGGQPINMNESLTQERGEVLWRLDRESAIRYSHENADVLALYEEYLGKPLGERSHHLLHTEHL